MRLSDAIALGRTVITPQLGIILDTPTSGCALGMGLAGSGADCVVMCKESSLANPLYKIVYKTWPWLATKIKVSPCKCQPNSIGFSVVAFNIFFAIGHVFDEHVMLDNSWTLDQLIDWIRSVEPVEEESISETNQIAVEVNPL